MSQTQEKNGTWTVQIRYKDWQGNRKHTTKRGFATKREAKLYEADYLANHATDCTMSFARLSHLYLQDTSRRLRQTTLANRQFIIDNFFNPVLGSIAINKITPETIRKWQMLFLEKKYSDTYTRTIDNMLVSIFSFACRYYDLPKNPAKLVSRIGKARNNHEDYWTIEDFDKFIDYLNNKTENNKAQIKRHVDDYSLTVAYTLFFYTGMRLGELLALTPNDINYHANTIHISKTYSQIDRGYMLIDLPTSDRSNRIINLPEKITNMIKDYIQRLPDLRQDDRIFFVLNKSNLRRWSNNRWRQKFKRTSRSFKP